MGIRSALSGLMSEVGPELSLLEAGQRMDVIAAELRDCVPVGYIVRRYAGRGGRTDTPWLGIFNPDISDKPQEGLYVAILRHADSAAVSLTVQQGIDELRRELGAKKAREQIADQAQRIRAAISLVDEAEPMRIGTGTRQRLYSAGSIAARDYLRDQLPSESQLRTELRSMLRILDAAHEVLQDAPIADWVKEPLGSGDRPMPAVAGRFVPKSSANYVVELQASRQVKTRLHEEVVNSLEELQRGLGWETTSAHPIDLNLRRTRSGETETLVVEVKTVRGGNAVEAVRAAIGQLFTYRHQLFEPAARASIGLVAAFSEDIEADLRQLLTEELGIAVLWLEARTWRGCDRAARHGLLSDGIRRAS
jgi:hypothetical protein